MRSRAPLLCILLTASAALLAPATLAQTPAADRGPDNGSSTFVPGIDILPLPGLPFTATDRIVWTRPVDGGGTITRYLNAKAIRDNQGRLYRERHQFGDINADPQTTLLEFTIEDPIAHTRTVCARATRVCHIVPYFPRFAVTLQPVGSFDQGRRYLTRQTLGNQTLQELPVDGTLETVTIAPGTLGNDQLITLSREFWYSPDLKTNLAVTRKDPRTGTEAVTLILLSRTDPDATVFTVPAGYRIEDNRPRTVPPTRLPTMGMPTP